MLGITAHEKDETGFYALSPNTTYCEISGAAVFLDIQHDRYLMLDRQQATLFRQLREGAVRGHALRLATRLVSAGILARHPEKTGTLDPFLRNSPISGITGPNPAGQRLNLYPAGTFRMAQAFANCAAIKRTKHIAPLLSAVRHWKRKAASKPASADKLVDPIVRRFHGLSPIFYSAHDACLFRSVILMRYLTLHQISADLVFGVRLSPFAAHCWVEHRGRVLNEHLETAASFTPILAV